MVMQEMTTSLAEDLPVTVVLLNNGTLGMVRQWQKLFYHQRYSSTELADTPDFVKLADAYGWKARRVINPADVELAFEEMLAYDGPFLLDLRIQRDQSVFPMVAPGRALTEVIGAIDADADGVRIIQSEADIKQREGASDER